MQTTTPLRVLVIDNNLGMKRLAHLPFSETIASEMAYILSIDPDILANRESMRPVDGLPAWEEIYTTYLPAYTLINVAIRGDGKAGLSIAFLVKKGLESRVSIECIDVTATSKLHPLPMYAENQVGLIWLDDKPQALVYHGYLVTHKDRLWVWDSEIDQIEEILSRHKVPVFADANFLQEEQRVRWLQLQLKYRFRHVFGTDAYSHYSFVGQPDIDWCPKIRTDKQVGFVYDQCYTDEAGEEWVVPRGAMDGALSDRGFAIVFPNVSPSNELQASMVPIKDWSYGHRIELEQAFHQVAELNQRMKAQGKHRVCGFDHIAFLFNIQ